MPLDRQHLAIQLNAISASDTFDAEALNKAKTLAELTRADQALLDRYLLGTQVATDHIKLQDLAGRILRVGAPASVPMAKSTLLAAIANDSENNASDLGSYAGRDAVATLLEHWDRQDVGPAEMADDIKASIAFLLNLNLRLSHLANNPDDKALPDYDDAWSQAKLILDNLPPTSFSL